MTVNMFSKKWFFIGIFLGLWLFWGIATTFPSGRLLIKFYDVGQGDSIFIKTPKGRTILIDGGPDNKITSYLGKDLPFYQRHLDILILTHPQADHLTGLIEVLNRYEVKMVLANKVAHTTNEYIKWLTLLSEKKVKVKEVYRGETIKIDEGKAVLEFFWPPKDFTSDLNELSIIFRLTFGNFSALFPGDAPAGVQENLYLLGGIPQTRVLKVSHHGARDGLSERFLEEIKPKLAIISVGKNNRFGHPAKKTLEMLKTKGIKILRTDIDGTIGIETDGEKWYYKKR